MQDFFVLKGLLVPNSSSSITLDNFDLSILNILQLDKHDPAAGDRRGHQSVAPAVQRRIRRMKEAGVIQANVAIVDPAQVGQAITIFVEVEVISETAELIDAAGRSSPRFRRCSSATTSPERLTSCWWSWYRR